MSSWLVVGLGNPGPAFASHRHNVGYRVADELARRIGARFSVLRGCRAEVAEGRIGPPGGEAPRLVLAKSRTFMNEAGWAVTRLLAYYKLEPAQMIVIHDELDIDPGQLRVKFGVATTATMGSSPSVNPSEVGSSSGYGSALAARRVGKIRPITCSATSRQVHARPSRSKSVGPRMLLSRSFRWGSTRPRAHSTTDADSSVAREAEPTCT